MALHPGSSLSWTSYLRRRPFVKRYCVAFGDLGIAAAWLSGVEVRLTSLSARILDTDRRGGVSPKKPRCSFLMQFATAIQLDALKIASSSTRNIVLANSLAGPPNRVLSFTFGRRRLTRTVLADRRLAQDHGRGRVCVPRPGGGSGVGSGDSSTVNFGLATRKYLNTLGWAASFLASMT